MAQSTRVGETCPKCNKGVLTISSRGSTTEDKNFRVIRDTLTCTECPYSEEIVIGQYKGGLGSFPEAAKQILAKCWYCGSPLDLGTIVPGTLRILNVQCQMAGSDACRTIKYTVFLDQAGNIEKVELSKSD